MQDNDYIILTIFIITLITVCYVAKKQRDRVNFLKKEYEIALEGFDKKIALDAGRKYYSALRKDTKLTIYDEQAITNDLMTMKNTNGN